MMSDLVVEEVVDDPVEPLLWIVEVRQLESEKMKNKSNQETNMNDCLVD